MASPLFYDRVRETANTTGTGALTLLGPLFGYQSFAIVGNGNPCFYCIANRSVNEWEVGVGTYTAAGTILSRSTVLASSNANALVNFSPGTKDVTLNAPAAALPAAVIAGGVYFGGPNAGLLQQNAANLFWDSTNRRLGIGTNAPAYDLDVPTGTIRGQILLGSCPLAGMPPALGAWNRNVLINGAFDIWQRGTTFVSPNGTYTADRWLWAYGGTHTVTVSQVADRPAVVDSFAAATRPVPYTNYCLQVTVTTAEAVLAAGDFGCVFQRIEGLWWQKFWQRTLCLSFWVKSSVPGTYCVTLLSGGNDKAQVQEYTINSANTWEAKTLIFSASPAAGTWNPTSSGIGATLGFALGCGTTYQTTPGTWQNALYLATANQTNLMATGGATFQLSQVMLEISDHASAFENRPYNVELDFCQRYYEKSYPYSTAPFTAASQPGMAMFPIQVSPLAAGAVMGFVPFHTTKRTTPTVTTCPFATPTNTNRVSDLGGTDQPAGSGGKTGTSDKGFGVWNNSGGTITPSSGGFMVHWIAEAEL